MHTTMTQRRQNVSVDCAGKDHFGHFQSVIISHPAAFDDRLLDAQFFCQVAELLATAMNNTDANAYLVKQGELFTQRD